MRRRRLIPGALALAVLAAPTAAQARAPLPSASVGGVKVALGAGGTLTIRFSKGRAASRAFAVLQGRRVKVTCTDFDHATRGTTRLDLPKHFSLIRLSGLTAGYEVCSLSRPGRPRILVVALDAAGRSFLADVRAVHTVRGVVATLRRLAKADPDEHYPTAAAFAKRDRKRFAAIAGPRDAAPAGRIGVFSDGLRHASVVLRSASGHRFFYEVDGTAVQTNVTPVEARLAKLDG